MTTLKIKDVENFELNYPKVGYLSIFENEGEFEHAGAEYIFEDCKDIEPNKDETVKYIREDMVLQMLKEFDKLPYTTQVLDRIIEQIKNL